jgi:drug/metabolite transporter (DMT)-like permease
MSSSPVVVQNPSAAPGLRGRLPELVLVLVTLVWGGTFLVAQLALRETGPFGLLALRFSVAALAIGALFFRRVRGLGRAELRVGAGIGVVTFAAYGLQTAGLQHIPSSRSAFLVAMYVPLVPLLQLALLRRSPRAAAWAGISLSFVGLLLLSAGEGLSPELGRGDWLTLGGALASAMQIVLVSRYAPGADPIRLAFVQLATVAALSLLALPVSGEGLPPLTPLVVGASVGLGLVATAFVMAAMNWAQQTVPATRATVIYAMEPVWGGIVGALAGEAMSAGTVGGSALIVLGVLVSEIAWPARRRKRRKAPAAPARGAAAERLAA